MVSDTIKVNTGIGQVALETGTITGKLQAIIVSSNIPVSVTISSKLGYLVFHHSSCLGVNYYAPRAVMQGAEQRLINTDQFDEFVLDEGLDIVISGPANEEVELILRYE